MTVFKDVNTPSPLIETFTDVDEESAKAALPDHIYMDSVSCGLGMCCLQVMYSRRRCTVFQGENKPIMHLNSFDGCMDVYIKKSLTACIGIAVLPK